MAAAHWIIHTQGGALGFGLRINTKNDEAASGCHLIVVAKEVGTWRDM